MSRRSPRLNLRDTRVLACPWKFEPAPELYPSSLPLPRDSPSPSSTVSRTRGLDLPLRMAAGLGVARSRRNTAKNPQPQLRRSTGTGIRGIPGASAEAVKIPPFSLLLSPFASPVENYLCTRAYRKRSFVRQCRSLILPVTCIGKIEKYQARPSCTRNCARVAKPCRKKKERKPKKKKKRALLPLGRIWKGSPFRETPGGNVHVTSRTNPSCCCARRVKNAKSKRTSA